MKNIKDLKQTIGENTEKLEKQAGQYYFALEPWQRGSLALGLILLSIALIYWLTKEDKSKLTRQEARREALLEEKLIKQMVLLNRLKG